MFKKKPLKAPLPVNENGRWKMKVEKNLPPLWARITKADKRATKHYKKAQDHARAEQSNPKKVVKHRTKWYKLKTSWWIDAPLGLDATGKDFNPKKAPFPIKGDNEILTPDEALKREDMLSVGEDKSIQVNLKIDENHSDYKDWATPSYTNEEFDEWKKNSPTAKKITENWERVLKAREQQKRDFVNGND